MFVLNNMDREDIGKIMEGQPIGWTIKLRVNVFNWQSKNRNSNMDPHPVEIVNRIVDPIPISQTNLDKQIPSTTKIVSVICLVYLTKFHVNSK